MPQTRPTHGQAQDQKTWREVCATLPDSVISHPSSITCGQCQRYFKSCSGLARHNCFAICQLPVHEQPGAQQCSVCQRWFKTAEGLAVHKCVPVGQPQLTPTQAVLSQLALDLDTSTKHPVLNNMSCCLFH